MIGLAVLSGGMAAVMGSSFDVWQDSQSSAQIDRDANRSLRKISEHLTWAGRDSAPGCFGEEAVLSSIDFRPVAGVSGGKVIWGAVRRIQWVADTRDPTDGVDNNTNNVLDEGAVLLVVDTDLPTENRTLLCRGVTRYLEGELPNGLDDNGNGLVDEPGLCFARKGNSIIVLLTIRRTGMDGRPVLRTLETAVNSRN